MSIPSIALLSLIELFGDMQLKFFARSGNPMYLVGGVVGWGSVLYLLVQNLKHANILWTKGIWDGLSTLIQSIVLFFVLGERLTSLKQYAGLASIMVGTFLLSMDKIPR